MINNSTHAKEVMAAYDAIDAAISRYDLEVREATATLLRKHLDNQLDRETERDNED